METANMTHENSMAGPTGWYVIHPDCGVGWVAVRLDRSGQMAEMFEQYCALQQNGRRADIVNQIVLGTTNPDISAADATVVIAAWDENADPIRYTVERVVGN